HGGLEGPRPGGTLAPVEERELAEVLARVERVQGQLAFVAGVDGDLDRALDDDVHPVALIALVEDARLLRELDLFQPRGRTGEVRGRERLEEGDGGKQARTIHGDS